MRPIVLVALLLVGCNQPDSSKPTGPPGRKTIKRSELREALKKINTTKQLAELIGKPDKTTDEQPDGPVTWYYYRLTVDDANDKVDDETAFIIYGSSVNRVTFK